MKKVPKTVIKTIMDKAIEINARCKEECRDFTIMVSPMRKNTLLLRWTTIDIEDIDRPKQCYRYECFHMDGSPQNCSVNYANQQEANDFFASLKKLHQQEFCIDHKL